MNSETLLLRQVNLSWIQDGRVTSQLFRPTPKDSNRLSVDNGDIISAEKSYKRFTNNPKCKSVGVLAVSMKECEDQELPVNSDPIQDNPEHMVIIFDGYSSNQIRKKSKHLRGYAVERGWQYKGEIID